ncbi:hypothetical protein AVEN_41081-1 [Araneus ventricosus]|uniref:C2H2-type domain-containing protein n=1 Tax=Araneus ventricosus TaxID=182803 RepID=A0A4Y2CKK3_ARAVE|nr:hypothetical protein AVEN_41081-1 [Araneus ventricosus]
MNQHYLTHINEKPHSCEVCGKAFALKNNLNRHYLTHTKEKPHSCEICQKAFTRKYCLSLHYLTHTKEKPHSCELTEFERGRVVGLREGGFFSHDIAERLGRNVSTVHDCLQQWSRESTASRIPGFRMPRGTTEREDRRREFGVWLWRIVLRLRQKFELQLAPQ